MSRLSHWYTIKKIIFFLGPAFLIAVWYMDPGNWATDIAGGSQFGYALLWVLLMSNLMAIVLQYLSCKLWIAANKDLAQASRMMYPRFTNFCLWVLAEVAIIACDLAEIIGMAIGLQLLFWLPLLRWIVISAFDTFFILWLQKYGIRKIEAIILSFIMMIAICFSIELTMSQPVLSSIMTWFIPHIPNSAALYIAIGIIGATVMPHNLYLHSSLVQTRQIWSSDTDKRKALGYNFIDILIALSIALFINCAILLVAASAFYVNGYTSVATIHDAYKLLEPLLGTHLAPTLFAIALIIAGQSSTVTGTLAGQVVMEWHIALRIRPRLRRLITRSLAIIPAVVVLMIYGESKVNDLLILSQVILSMQLGFAIIPLIISTSKKSFMGNFVNKTWLTTISSLIAMIIIWLNISLLYTMISSQTDIIVRYSWVMVLLLILSLLIYIFIYPLIHIIIPKSLVPHMPASPLILGGLSPYKHIAITIDFSNLDQNTISRAVHDGGKDALYSLIHIIETPGATIYQSHTHDHESQQDSYNLDNYRDILIAQWYRVDKILGYGDPASAIIHLVKQHHCDLLVMGQHGHTGMADILQWQTINTVRHSIIIPLLIVS